MRHGSRSPLSNTGFAAGVEQVEEAHVQPSQLDQHSVNLMLPEFTWQPVLVSRAGRCAASLTPSQILKAS